MLRNEAERPIMDGKETEPSLVMIGFGGLSEEEIEKGIAVL
ncbi:hypothetical protein [Peribacillus phoenicis]